MTMAQPQMIGAIGHAVRAVCSALDDNVTPGSWERLGEPALWRELVAGILGSRAPYEVALRAVEALEQDGLLDGKAWLSRLSCYQRRLEATLSGDGDGAQTERRALRYPYPRQRAARIRGSVAEIYGKRQSIRGLLRKADGPHAARRELAERIPGIGPKQASMFLRNVGYPGEFAVLDAHVLTYMQWNALLPEAEPRVQTIREYEHVESVFLDHVHGLGACPGKFDVAVWVVMRVAKREQSACRW